MAQALIARLGGRSAWATLRFCPWRGNCGLELRTVPPADVMGYRDVAREGQTAALNAFVSFACAVRGHIRRAALLVGGTATARTPRTAVLALQLSQLTGLCLISFGRFPNRHVWRLTLSQGESAADILGNGANREEECDNETDPLYHFHAISPEQSHAEC